jgi:hypothetical protein
VHHVPREVLTKIFALVGTGAVVVPLTHACRRWRHIALRTPKLWTSLSDRDLTNILPLFIERSQRAPLDVSVSISSDDTHRLERLTDLQVASSHLRSFEVKIAGSFTDAVKNAFSHFHKPAPLLTTLSIRFDHDVKVPPPESLEAGDAFSRLFGREHPMLSSLSLKSLRPWTPPLSETLTTLTLASLFLSANDLYPCLEAVPNLRFLALLNVMTALRRLCGYPGSNILGPAGYSVHTPAWGPFQTFRTPDDPPPISATRSRVHSDGGVRHPR